MRGPILSILVLLLPALAHPQDASPTTTPLPTLPLAGKLGIGMADSSIATLTASLSYWVSDQTALELLGQGLFGTSRTYGYGLGVKTVLASPHRNFRLQGLVQATYDNTWYYPFPQGAVGSFDLSLGPGFEWFLPFCEAFSLEGSLLATFSVRPSDEGTSFGFFTPWMGLSPFRLRAHVYF